MQLLHPPPSTHSPGAQTWRRRMWVLCALLSVSIAIPYSSKAQTIERQSASLPHRAEAQERHATRRTTLSNETHAQSAMAAPHAEDSSASSSWTSIGPAAESTASFGLLSGRVTALAPDPSDSSGNRLYVGTTGGGVWFSQNAASSPVNGVTFSPLTDGTITWPGVTPASPTSMPDASLSIGALTVQPGGTGVVLAGSGDPNDALDSWYGGGILYSANSGSTWRVISTTPDTKWGFQGLAFAGFAWSTASPSTVVAAVSEAYEGMLVNALRPGLSFMGLYYSDDAGATWKLSTITDGDAQNNVIQGPSYTRFDYGNAVTSVVWNPIRKVFIAAVRYHGYYESQDGGVTFVRMANQPGKKLTPTSCPTHSLETGSTGCPIFRGALAVNPWNGDTFAWTTDIYNQDQGLWRDVCGISGGSCATDNDKMAFGTQLSTTALECVPASVCDSNQNATIADADYTLSLSAVPYALNASTDTILLAGGVDLWRCSVANSCAWINTTNSLSCPGYAQVESYQHAQVWNTGNPDLVFIGNDGGLWRSTDQVGKTTSGCSSSDASHFQNLNANLGPLTEVGTLSQTSGNPYAMMAGLGILGTVGVNGTSAPSGDWTQILTGQGGPSAIDGSAWYVNNGAGISMEATNTAPTGFSSVLDYSTSPLPLVVEDGYMMMEPAAFVVDPLDNTQLLIATCRVWRGPASGSGWTSANAISPILDGGSNSYCEGDAMIRSITAQKLADGTEKIYVGQYGSLTGGETLAGHVFGATYDPNSSAMPTWNDLSLPQPAACKSSSDYCFDISSVVIDPLDATGKTVYATEEGMSSRLASVLSVYRSTDGGASWTALQGNLPWTPVHALAVDPLDSNTVYLGTDLGVYATQKIANCASGPLNCWSLYGTGLPLVPVTALAANSGVLTAATYGRGLWQIPSWTSGMTVTTATISPTSLSFGNQAENTTSTAQTVTLTNTGSTTLVITGIAALAASGNFDCTTASGSGNFPCSIPASGGCGSTLAASSSCTIAVSFAPTTLGPLTSTLTIAGNMAANLTMPLSGTGIAPPTFTVTPASLPFADTPVGSTSAALSVSVGNTGSSAINISSLSVTAPFAVYSNGITSGNGCGSSVAAGYSCNILLSFTPTTAGSFSGTMTLVDDAGTQTITLTGTGLAAPTDTLSPTALSFAATPIGQSSATQFVTLSNSGGAQLTEVTFSVSGPFQISNYCSYNVAGESQCSVGVVYAPTAVGTQSGTLTETDELPSSGKTVALTGTGVQAGSITATPAILSFTEKTVGATTAAQAITITNSGGATISNLGFTLSNTSFVLGTTTCGTTLAAGAACTLPVTFTAQTLAGVTARLTITSSTQGVLPATVYLSGNGGVFPAAILTSPTVVNLGTVGLSQASSPATITITNTGTADSLQTLDLTFSNEFWQVNNTCPATLAPLDRCTVGVEFVPTATGAQTGSLTITSSTATTATVALYGTGLGFTLTASPTSQTVTRGSTATYTLTITPAGASGTFTLSCSGVPNGSTCTINPVRETLSSQGSATVQIATGTTTSRMHPLFSPRSGLPLLCLLLLSLRQRRWAAFVLLLLLPVALGNAGCAASGRQNTTSGITDSGTYLVQVTATADGLSQTVILTLVID